MQGAGGVAGGRSLLNVIFVDRGVCFVHIVLGIEGVIIAGAGVVVPIIVIDWGEFVDVQLGGATSLEAAAGASASSPPGLESSSRS